MWGWWAKKWSLHFFFLASFSSRLPHCLYSHTLLWLRSESDALMFGKNVCSGPRDACHMKESNLSLVSSTLISPCLLTSSDLWLVCTWSGERERPQTGHPRRGRVTLRKKKEKKKKTKRLAERQPSRGKKRDGDRVGGDSFIFLSVDLNVWRKNTLRRTWEHSKLKLNLVTWNESMSLRLKLHKHDPQRQWRNDW